ncbi:putative ClpA ClpB family protein [Lyophyllum shimeji]|uniref:ClpA ClpB family protein n=1 Tax=Lyophyllum shimeji TaxID=47721 RepID=A0A9P3PJI7_LYOSH|nr:putative ClpA ClpB family protein [Lyophyllum shimeji]
MAFAFTDKVQRALSAAIQLAKYSGNPQLHPEHIAYVLINEGSRETNSGSVSLFSSVVQSADVDRTTVQRALSGVIVQLPTQSPPPDEIPLNSAALKAIREAPELQMDMHDSCIAQDHLLRALIKDPCVAALLKELGLDEAAMTASIEHFQGNGALNASTSKQGFNASPTYAVDLTALAEQGNIGPVVGRENEIRDVIRVLCRMTRNNPVLVGEPGVGKTTIAKGLAQRIVNRDVPPSLNARLYSLDIGTFNVGTSKEYEERIKSILSEVEKAADGNNSE